MNMSDFELVKTSLNLQQKRFRLILETSYCSKTSEVVQWKFNSPNLLTEFYEQLSSVPAINVDNCLGVSGGVDELSHFLKLTPVRLILA